MEAKWIWYLKQFHMEESLNFIPLREIKKSQNSHRKGHKFMLQFFSEQMMNWNFRIPDYVYLCARKLRVKSWMRSLCKLLIMDQFSKNSRSPLDDLMKINDARKNNSTLFHMIMWYTVTPNTHTNTNPNIHRCCARFQEWHISKSLTFYFSLFMVNHSNIK